MGYDNVCIHGGVPTSPDDSERDEREIRQRQFADPNGVRILLSTEVGDEAEHSARPTLKKKKWKHGKDNFMALP
jgi:hypothetical protein